MPDARLLHVPDDAAHGALHVAGLQHHLVMLGAGEIGHVLGRRALVESQLEPRGRAQIEADREGAQLRMLARGDRGDRARIDAAREIGADRHVAHELAAHGLAKETIELLDKLFRAAVELVGEAEIPVALDTRRGIGGNGHAHEAAGRKKAHVLEQRA